MPKYKVHDPQWERSSRVERSRHGLLVRFQTFPSESGGKNTVKGKLLQQTHGYIRRHPDCLQLLRQAVKAQHFDCCITGSIPVGAAADSDGTFVLRSVVS